MKKRRYMGVEALEGEKEGKSMGTMRGEIMAVKKSSHGTRFPRRQLRRPHSSRCTRDE